MECEYCKKQFSTKSNLKLHIKTAKYCLQLRQNAEEINNFQCEFCKTTFNRKSHLNTHIEKCKEKETFNYNQKIVELNTQFETKINEMKKQYDLQITKLENNNKDLQKQLKDLTEKAIEKAINKPTYDQRTTTNSSIKNIDNRTLNMVPMNLTQESILKALEEKFTENHLMQGQKGLADFFIENVLISSDGKYLMKCTDPSRRNFIYIDETGSIQKDINADKFTKMINGPVKKVSKKIYDDLYDRYTNNYNVDEENEETENDEDRVNYATDKLVEITSLKKDNSEFVKRLVPPLSN